MQRHFVAVWNPSYSADPMDGHLAILLEQIRKHREEDQSSDDVYVWWGKVRSRNRVEPLPHDALIAEVADELAANNSTETHLYLTDYRSLYVGQITAMEFDEVRDSDPGRVAKYMRKRSLSSHSPAAGEKLPYELNVDCWFKLTDIRRLVLDDTVGVVGELAVLRNTQYHDRPVSLYGGMVDLPLVVTRPDERSFFSTEERDHVSERKWWVELDAERGRGIAEIERDLRDNVIGEEAWAVFDPTARAFLADGERVFREHRHDASFDYSSVVLNFAKAIEVHFRWLVRSALASPAVDSIVTIHDKPRDLRRGEMPTLGQLGHLAKKDKAFQQLLRTLQNGDWLTRDFTQALDQLSQIRNDAAHDERIDLSKVTQWRNYLLGVGCAGLIEQLARVRPRRP